MTFSRGCFGRALGLFAVSAILIFSAGNAAQAQGLSSAALAQRGSAVPDGLAVMARVRVPLGGGFVRDTHSKKLRRARTVFALTAGIGWRDETGSPEFTGPRYISTLEAGFTGDGDPVVKLGPVDLAKSGDGKE